MEHFRLRKENNFFCLSDYAPLNFFLEKNFKLPCESFSKKQDKLVALLICFRKNIIMSVSMGLCQKNIKINTRHELRFYEMQKSIKLIRP